MAVSDVINVDEIRVRIEPLLIELADEEVDVFISPGTPAMQVAWYLAQSTLGLSIRLFQTTAAKLSADGKPKLKESVVQQSTVPIAAIIKEKQVGRPAQPDFLLTDSLKSIYDRAFKVAQTDDVRCLIQGASGTGKERLARSLHDQSVRRNQPFIAVNCSSLTDSLLESRLFGHRKGAFTGATENAVGLFEAAKGGTLFLDEIGDISPFMQQSLLRVLQEREISRVGETSSRKVDVRVIAATHQNLRQRCRDGLFRWDLFYRLSVVELTLPTLAEQGVDEKRALITFLLKAKAKVFRRKKPLTLDKTVWALLENYLFPGNVRELENLIESLYVFCTDQVSFADLPGWLTSPDVNDGSTSFLWSHHERSLIVRTLHYYNGNKAKAQRALGYGSINTLVRKMEEYGV
ncbi:hypothetical protein GCM10023187_10370 [Nibrella viscosa]|uniref:Sigma-54 factor interaction domain-containing protein n=2 Tax=Nibrella viscosa TaxID=1084524 RepID=A0ABP8K184_9BACT